MAVAHWYGKESITTNDTGLSTGGSITLTGAANGKIQHIKTICLSTAGTVTAFNIQVTKNDGTTIITQFGGLPAAVNPSVSSDVWNFELPIVCVVNDNAKVIATVTGATGASVAISANYFLATG